ncbi:MAG: response regulator [Planctomycetota bacterium]
MSLPNLDHLDAPALRRELAKLQRVNDVLVRRVEQSMDTAPSAFAIFETAILLEKRVQMRTHELAEVLDRLRETNRELAAAEERALAGSRAKSEFLAMMSHEIRTPLNGMIGLAELLGSTVLHEEQSGLVGGIARSAEMLLAILNDVLDLSKIEAGKMEIEVAPFELQHLLDDVRLLFDSACLRKGLRLRVQLDSQLPRTILGDATRLRQVLVNLVGNAMKFTSRGEIAIEVQAGSGPDEIRFAVRDTGIGISEEARARLFHPFTQADASMARKYGGTGLGLSISHQLCGLMGAELGVSSEVGRGSTFAFTLRAVRVADMPGENVAATTERFAARVLVVDDNQVNRTVALRMLEKLGCTATAVEDGPQALDAVARESFDLVLMDVQMPGMDGLEVTRRIRTGPTRASMPVLALTANAMSSDQQKCLDAGMSGYLHKPIRMKELARGLSEYLPESRRLA